MSASSATAAAHRRGRLRRSAGRRYRTTTAFASAAAFFSRSRYRRCRSASDKARSPCGLDLGGQLDPLSYPALRRSRFAFAPARLTKGASIAACRFLSSAPGWPSGWRRPSRPSCGDTRPESMHRAPSARCGARSSPRMRPSAVPSSASRRGRTRGMCGAFSHAAVPQNTGRRITYRDPATIMAAGSTSTQAGAMFDRAPLEP